MEKGSKTKKRAYKSIAWVLILAVMLAVTTYALILSMIGVKNNLFETGKVEIELNGGKKIFDDTDIEPGKSIVKEFTVKNESSAEVYYRIYADKVEGSMSEALEIRIYDGEEEIYKGKIEEMDRKRACVGEEALKAGEEKKLKAIVKLSESAGNKYQNGEISFDIKADAVQARNNPGKTFE